VGGELKARVQFFMLTPLAIFQAYNNTQGTSPPYRRKVLTAEKIHGK